MLMYVKIQSGRTVKIGVDNALWEYYEFTCGGGKLQHSVLGKTQIIYMSLNLSS
jgi:hypothetical protein